MGAAEELSELNGSRPIVHLVHARVPADGPTEQAEGRGPGGGLAGIPDAGVAQELLASGAGRRPFDHSMDGIALMYVAASARRLVDIALIDYPRATVMGVAVALYRVVRGRSSSNFLIPALFSVQRVSAMDRKLGDEWTPPPLSLCRERALRGPP